MRRQTSAPKKILPGDHVRSVKSATAKKQSKTPATNISSISKNSVRKAHGFHLFCLSSKTSILSVLFNSISIKYSYIEIYKYPEQRDNFNRT